MKIEFYPVTEAEQAAADDEHAKTRIRQHRFLNELADKIEAGETLSSWERKWAEGAIRAFADALPTERRKPNKRPPKVPGDAAVMVALRVVFDGWTKSAAMEEQAERIGISEISTIEKAIARQGYTAIKVSILKNRNK